MTCLADTHTIKSSFIGTDYNDYETLVSKGDEIHTFIGSSDGDERVLEAAKAAIGSDDAKAITSKASAAIMVVLRSTNTNKPLAMSEMQNISQIFDTFSQNCDVTWSVIDDDTLGDSIKVMFFVNVRK